MPASPTLPPGEPTSLTDSISAAMVGLYSRFYGHVRTRASTYINDRVVVCVLEDILTTAEESMIAAGASKQVIDGRVAFQNSNQDQFSAEVERLTQRNVVAFLSANQTAPGVACELFFLDSPPAVEA